MSPKSLETAKALTNLAIVQHHNQQYVPAQQNFQASIEIIEDADNRLSAHLVNPLKGLGAAQLESGRPDLALGTFGRAMHITHVNEGPHNLYQLELLQSLAEVNLRLGETSDARELQERMYLLNIRQHDSNSMALIPALMQRATWQHRVGLIVDERSTYRRVIQIIEKNEGKESLLLVTPLVSYGRSFFYSDMSGTIDSHVTSVSSGEMFFKRALRITENNPGASWRLRASTTLALGDYYSFIGSDNRARRTYTDAWEMLNDDEEQLRFRRNMLESVVLLEEKPIPEYIRSETEESGELLTATLTMGFAIDPRGRVGALRILEADPVVFPQMMRAVQRIMRTRAYRPRYEDAAPVASPDQLLVHTFYYRQSDLDALQEPGG